MKKRLMIALTALFALVLGLGVLSACGGGADGEMTISETEVTLAIGETTRLMATAKSGEEVGWTSSDENVVVIEQQIAARGIAVIKAAGAGKATVTAESASGKKVSCEVTVENITVEISGEGVADGKLQMERNTSLKLNAVVKKDGAVLGDTVDWASSDSSIVTVAEDGTLEAVMTGTATVTATRHGGGSRSEIEVTVIWSNQPQGWYTLEAWEQNKITPNLWGYWADAGYEPQYSTNIKVTNAEYLGDPTGTGLVAGGVTLSYENQTTGANEHGVQLFYRSSKGYNDANKDKEGFTPYDANKLLLDVNGYYVLKMDITVTASGTITVNDTQIDVVANEKQSIEVPFRHTDTGYIYPSGEYDNVGSAVYVMMGANGTMIQKATVTLENISWDTSWDGTTSTLQPPTFTLSGNTITITDSNKEGVKNYTVGIFAENAADGADPVRTMTVAAGAKEVQIDDAKWPDGKYELRIRANGKDARYVTSAWSQGTSYTVSHGAVSYDLKEGTSGDAKADTTDTYYYSVSDGAVMETATYNDGTITLAYKGNTNWYSVQLFYKNPALTAGVKYTLTFTLNSPLAGKIRINGTMFDLTVGDNPIAVSYTEGSGADGLSMSIQFGEPDPDSDYQSTVSVLLEGMFTLKDIVWERYVVPEGSIPDGSQADAVNNPGTWYLWWDQNWNGETVTMKESSIDEEKKTIFFSYTATGVNKFGAGVQLFYEHPGVTEGSPYVITLTIKVSVDCGIRVCGQVEHFTANTARTLTITQNEPGYGGEEYNEGATIVIIMGVENPLSNVLVADVTVSDWSVQAANAEKLQTPTNLAIADKKVTFTDPNEKEAKVGGYELGFFSGEDLKGTVKIAASGDTVDDSAIANGTYTVKVRALGKDAGYISSDWSQGIEYIVNNEGGPSYDLTGPKGESDVVQANDGKYYYWKENGTVKGTFKDGTVTLTVTGNTGNWYNVQLFMKDPALKAETTYKLTMTITLNVSGKIQVNGKVIDVTADQPYSYVNEAWGETENAASVSVQLGADGGGVVAESCVFTLSDVVFTEASKLSAPSFSLEGNKLTVTDTQNSGAAYILGFFKKADDAEPAYAHIVKDGEEIIGEMIEAGAYTLRLRAIKTGATESDWSQGTEYTVTATTGTGYTILGWGEEFNNQALASDKKWVYWTDPDNSVGVIYARLKEENGKYTISVKEGATKESGSLGWGFQLFHNDSTQFTKGTSYTLTFTAHAESDMTLTVNGQAINLTADTDTPVSIDFTLTVGTANDYNDVSLFELSIAQTVGTVYEFELKDISWTAKA